jgi:hydroxymethylbilane synthase
VTRTDTTTRAGIVIATRESALALWQAQNIQARLRKLYPQSAVTLLAMTTQGDRVLDRPLAQVGGKGLFVKELEQALTDGRADLAVHSMKDVPMMLEPGFTIAAVTEREDPRDAFVSRNYSSLAQLPPRARVGTSSLRRESQIRAGYPRLVVEPLRGNVPTRIKKLDDGQYAAIMLAVAGLKRLELADRITAILEPEQSLPAPGQGALGLECRSDRSDIIAMLRALNDDATAACVHAERAFSRALSGSCQVPLGAYAQVQGTMVRLRGFVGSQDGSRMVSGELSAARDDAEKLGAELAATLRSRGAGEILAALESQP